LRARLAAKAEEPIPARLRVGNLMAQRARRRGAQLARAAAVVGLLVLGGAGGWTLRDLASG
jgi:hypothetical protein